MKIICLHGTNNVYSSNAYLVTGSWNKLEDVNTLIDVGSDSTIIEAIMAASTGVGKHKIDQVILTHNHSDHIAALPEIIRHFHPKVYAFLPFDDNGGEVLRGGQAIRLGDRMFEVIHTPGHSSDSISLYNEDDGVLFVGDTPVVIKSPTGSYEENYVRGLESLCQRRVQAIYFGHGEPLLRSAQATILMTLKNVRLSQRNADSRA